MNWQAFVSGSPPQIKARATGQGRNALFMRELNAQKHGLNKSRTLTGMVYNGSNQAKHTEAIR